MKRESIFRITKVSTLIFLLLAQFGCNKHKNIVSPDPAPKMGSLVIAYKDVITPSSVSVEGKSYITNLSDNVDCNSSVNVSKMITLTVGTYDLIASNGIVNWNQKIDVKESCTTIVLDGSNTQGEKKGLIYFNNNDESGMRKIEVKLNSQFVGTIQESIQGPGVVTTPTEPIKVEYPIGNYSYTADSENGQHWDGNVTVTNGKRTDIQLQRFNSKPISSTQSNLTFYSPSTNNINVYLSNSYKGHTLSSYEDNTNDLCNRKWVVSIVVSQGTYNYTASSSNGKAWSGTVVANGGGECKLIRLP